MFPELPRLACADSEPHGSYPPKGRKWWMESDEPWQTLACCMEVAQAVRSPDPAAYISHLPVHQVGMQMDCLWGLSPRCLRNWHLQWGLILNWDCSVVLVS